VESVVPFSQSSPNLRAWGFASQDFKSYAHPSIIIDELNIPKSAAAESGGALMLLLSGFVGESQQGVVGEGADQIGVHVDDGPLPGPEVRPPQCHGALHGGDGESIEEVLKRMLRLEGSLHLSAFRLIPLGEFWGSP